MSHPDVHLRGWQLHADRAELGGGEGAEDEVAHVGVGPVVAAADEAAVVAGEKRFHSAGQNFAVQGLMGHFGFRRGR